MKSNKSKLPQAPKLLLPVVIIFVFVTVFSLAKTNLQKNLSSVTPASPIPEPGQSIFAVGGFESPFPDTTIRFIATGSKGFNLIAGTLGEEIIPSDSVATQREILNPKILWRDEGKFSVYFTGKRNNSEEILVWSTPTNFYLMKCQLFEGKNDFISCNSPHTLPHLAEASLFILSDDTKSVIVAEPNVDTSTKFFLIDTHTLEKKELLLSNQNTYVDLNSPGVYPLSSGDGFAYWSRNPNTKEKTITIYSDGSFSVVRNIPETTMFGSSKYNIDGFGKIFATSAKDVCFQWTISGGHGVIRMLNGQVIHNPGGDDECPNNKM